MALTGVILGAAVGTSPVSLAELAFRIGVTVFVIVAPTLTFLGFWRILMKMRDGEFVARALSHEQVDDEWSPDGFDFSTFLGAGPAAGHSGTGCPHCGSEYPPEARFCAGCLGRL